MATLSLVASPSSSSDVCFNVLVTGRSGLGKTRFVENLVAVYGRQCSGQQCVASERGSAPEGARGLARMPTLERMPAKLRSRLPPRQLPGGAPGAQLHVALQDSPGYEAQAGGGGGGGGSEALFLAKMVEFVLRQYERDYRAAGGAAGGPRAHSLSLVLYFLPPEGPSALDLLYMSALSRTAPLLPVLAAQPPGRPHGGSQVAAGDAEAAQQLEQRAAVAAAMQGYSLSGQPAPILPTELLPPGPDATACSLVMQLEAAAALEAGHPQQQQAQQQAQEAQPAPSQASCAALLERLVRQVAAPAGQLSAAMYEDVVGRYELCGCDMMGLLAEATDPYQQLIREATAAAAAAPGGPGGVASSAGGGAAEGTMLVPAAADTAPEAEVELKAESELEAAGAAPPEGPMAAVVVPMVASERATGGQGGSAGAASAVRCLMQRVMLAVEVAAEVQAEAAVAAEAAASQVEASLVEAASAAESPTAAEAKAAAAAEAAEAAAEPELEVAAAAEAQAGAEAEVGAVYAQLLDGEEVESDLEVALEFSAGKAEEAAVVVLAAVGPMTAGGEAVRAGADDAGAGAVHSDMSAIRAGASSDAAADSAEARAVVKRAFAEAVAAGDAAAMRSVVQRAFSAAAASVAASLEAAPGSAAVRAVVGRAFAAAAAASLAAATASMEAVVASADTAVVHAVVGRVVGRVVADAEPAASDLPDQAAAGAPDGDEGGEDTAGGCGKGCGKGSRPDAPPTPDRPSHARLLTPAEAPLSRVSYAASGVMSLLLRSSVVGAAPAAATGRSAYLYGSTAAVALGLAAVATGCVVLLRRRQAA